jgi:hypothetical protein
MLLTFATLLSPGVLPPSPPAKQSSACQEQAGENSATISRK